VLRRADQVRRFAFRTPLRAISRDRGPTVALRRASAGTANRTWPGLPGGTARCIDQFFLAGCRDAAVHARQPGRSRGSPPARGPFSDVL